MDTSDPLISFNGLGQCNHCIEFLSNTQRIGYRGASSDAKRAALVAEMKRAGQGLEYDCVVGLSGGIDSCYAAYQVKQLGLRALLVHMDNGWNSDSAVKNIKQVVDTLGFDYQSYVLNWSEFKAVQVAFLKASIIDAEIPTDIAIPAAMHAVAAEHGVKYLISGGNVATEGILPKSWACNAKDTALFDSIVSRFCSQPVSSVPTFGFAKEAYYKFIKGIRIVYLLNLMPFSKRDALAVLKQQFDWNEYGHKHSESRYTGFLQSYILPVKFNVDYRKATLSTQICTGEVSREQALLQLKLLPYDVSRVEQDKRYVCKKLDLSLDEFENIMKLPVKTFRDYSNDQSRLEAAYRLYRFLQSRTRL
jgi:N-acetyl sugar amidotransferase